MQRRMLSILIGIALVGVMAAPGAWAQNAHFISSQTSASINTSTCALVVDYKASGFGSGAEVALLLESNPASATLGCINRGENEPQGLRTFTGQVTETATDTANRTGTVTGTISGLLDAAESFSCPSHNMREVCISAEYCNIRITATDTTDSTLTTGEFTVTRGTDDDECVSFTRPTQ